MQLEYTVRTQGWNLVQKKKGMQVMKSGKWHFTDGMELPNQDKIRTLGEKETYKYFLDLLTETDIEK